MFDAKMANIRGYIAKARTDLQSKNIATAKTELELIDQVFETLKASATDENKKIIEGLQSTLKKAKTEIDTDLPSAINRIDLLWHEMSKLLRKG
jgi:molecular chaperone GrpE (heat shock protein)